ncbi:MAG TPA: tetratricopeptide repeat protein [Terriglobia bacterium]|nr:tetratricopeptide repeat protein [Terriglobia bacterium]
MSPSVAKSSGKTPKAKISDNDLARLRDDLVSRRIGAGIDWLESHRAFLAALDPSQKDGAVFLGYLAQWVDIGFDQPRLVKELLTRFSQAFRAALPLSDYVHIRMAEGLVAMSEENSESAIPHFETVLSLENEIQDQELVAIANFWIGRCQRKMGRYDSALRYTVKGKELALRLEYPKMAAVMQVLESWLLFQEGKPQEARRILKEAEAVLLETDDYVTRGNIQSAYGRIARRQGRYDQALQHFADSIEEYKKRSPLHRHLARALANTAFVKRLIAARLGKKIDREVARRLKTAGSRHAGPAAFPKVRERAHLERLRAEALAHLDQAEQIYSRYDDHRGLGTVHVDRGLLCLDGGDLDGAANEAAAAYRLGEDKKDYILEARARILQSTVENAKFEEQIEEKSDTHHAQLACDFARDAVEYAKHTQNRRLLARAYIVQGFVLANEFFGDPQAAGESCDRAAALLKPEGQDYVWEDLQVLRRKLLKAGSIDSVLREWSQGIVGDKTFQQITEEFAGIVIPKVWKREGRKVSRVAARLSISPKKVRRILSNSGLIEGKDGKHEG